jgi:hypothetical protein
MEFSEEPSEYKVIEIAGRIRFILMRLQDKIEATVAQIKNLSWMDKSGASAVLAAKLRLIGLRIDDYIFLEKTAKKTLRFSWPKAEMSVMPTSIMGKTVALKKVIDQDQMGGVMRGILEESGFTQAQFRIDKISYEREIKV